jgi:hypothetical protein
MAALLTRHPADREAEYAALPHPQHFGRYPPTLTRPHCPSCGRHPATEGAVTRILRMPTRTQLASSVWRPRGIAYRDSLSLRVLVLRMTAPGLAIARSRHAQSRRTCEFTPPGILATVVHLDSVVLVRTWA